MGRLFFCLVLLLLVSFAIFFLLPDEDEFEGIDGPSSSTKKAGKKKHKKLSKEELYDAFIDTPEKEAPSVMMQARSQKNWADTDWEDPYVEFVDENEILDRIKTEEFTGVFFYSMDSDHHRFAVKRWWSKLGREMKKRKHKAEKKRETHRRNSRDHRDEAQKESHEHNRHELVIEHRTGRSQVYIIDKAPIHETFSRIQMRPRNHEAHRRRSLVPTFGTEDRCT